MTHLVVLTGYPSAGKSSIAHYLANQHGFVCVASDDLRKALYGREFPDLLKLQDFERRDGLVWTAMEGIKQTGLNYGLDVVIDSFAPTNDVRARHLAYVGSVSKYLVHVTARPEVRGERSKLRGRMEDLTPMMEKYWEEPVASSDCQLVTVDNNCSQDLERICAELTEQLNLRYVKSAPQNP